MDEVRLRRLISLWVDEAIDSDEMSALAETLKESEQARRIYLVAMGINAELHNSATGQRYLDQVMISDKTTIPILSPSRKSPSLLRWGSLALAASLLVASVIWGTTRLLEHDVAFQPLNQGTESVEIRAEVVNRSEDCRWYVEHAERNGGQSFRSSDILRVTQGKLEIRYANGVKVFLEAPAAYQLISEMKSRMLLGQLTAEVSELGKGFSVITPRATVIDLGTKFSVNVNDDGATDVVVFKGEVDVDYRADNIEDSKAQRLQMGEAVRLDAAGTASRIVSITNHAFSESKGESQRPVIIAQVRDNIDRMSSLNYYEIVHQGMCEDALAFVDREAHQWNGVDESGMPPYLIGGDYVKMFNNDKFNHEIRVNVKLTFPANLYVLFDNRLPVPEWLRNGFRDTGDDIGMDAGPFFSKGARHNETPPGIGPGLSVEDTFSVWVKEVSVPGNIYLGSTEAPELEPNMYGIVAVPLNAL